MRLKMTDMTNDEGTFEELLKKSKERAGVATLGRVMDCVAKHQESSRSIPWQRKIISSNNSSN